MNTSPTACQKIVTVRPCTIEVKFSGGMANDDDGSARGAWSAYVRDETRTRTTPHVGRGSALRCTTFKLVSGSPQWSGAKARRTIHGCGTCMRVTEGLLTISASRISISTIQRAYAA